MWLGVSQAVPCSCKPREVGGAQFQENGGQEKTDVQVQQSGRESRLPSCLLHLFPSGPHQRGQSVSLSAPIQMLKSSGNTLTEPPRNPVSSGHIDTEVYSPRCRWNPGLWPILRYAPASGRPTCSPRPRLLMWPERITSSPRLCLISPLLSFHTSASNHRTHSMIPHIKRKSYWR